MDSKTLGVERVSVWLFTEDDSVIVCEDLYKLSENLHEKGLRLHASAYPRYFEALEDGRVVAANDACTDPRTSELTDGYLKTWGITSMMDAPVRLYRKLVGIVCHEHVGPRREWTAEEQDFAASIADMVSLSLESSARKRAEEELQKRLKELENYYRVTMGRESRIIDLKHEVNELLERLGEKKKYLTNDQ
jgi:GAF domain-containing protein